MKVGIWDYDVMVHTLQKNLREYQGLRGHYRQIKRRAILVYIGWMRKVRAGQEP